ncbi:MAG: GNAT family N-acetyltransferase [Treponema sp.]|nr:GNAT family N-acetyltransferase [Treponema sp.]
MNNYDRPRRWRKMKKRETAGSEALLRKQELLCVGACGKFLHRDAAEDHVWTLKDSGDNISALVIQSRRSLFPVLNGQAAVPLPRFLTGFFGNASVHAVQGLREESILLENGMTELGFTARENIDYNLMSLDAEPDRRCFTAGPPGLIIRQADVIDTDALFILQSGYEKEEVIPRDAEFNPAACRLTLQHILGNEQILAAEFDGRLVGKINTSMTSFTRKQIGGVYVHPDYRGLGIARRMTAEFVRILIARGWGTTLFVKKSNTQARAAYLSVGFKFLADYRISYY